MTNTLLAGININSLRKQGNLQGIDLTQLELSEAQLNIDISTLTQQFSKNELEYVDIIKQWLKLHQNFFTANEKLLKRLVKPNNTPKAFKEYLQMENKEKFTEWLTGEYKAFAKSGKTIAIMLHCLKQCSILKTPLPMRSEVYRALQTLFEYEIKENAVNKYLDGGFEYIQLQRDIRDVQEHMHSVEKAINK